MNFITKTFILTFFVTLSVYVNTTYSQEYDVQFEHISIEDGLSQSSVFCILQDYRGFIWLGTHDGLNRYDGYNFLIFKNNQNDSTSISGNIIKSIYETKDSLLLIGTFGDGLNIFNREKNSFKCYLHDTLNPNSLNNNVIRDIEEDKTGIIWLATEGGGLNKFDLKTEKFVSFVHNPENENSLSNNEVNDIQIDSNGKIWLATNGGLNLFDPETEKFTHFFNDESDENSISSNFLPCVYEDKSGNIWIGSREGINLYQPEKKTFKTYKHNSENENSLCNNVVLKILEDDFGYLWIGTSDGISIFDVENEIFNNYQHNVFDNKSLSYNNIASIYKDKAGIIWLGTWERGINKFDIKSKKFKLYKNNANQSVSLPDKTIRSIFYEGNDIIWIGYVEGGLVRFDRKNNKIDNYTKSTFTKKKLLENTITSIIRDIDGDLWLGTWNYGIQKAIFSKKDSSKIIGFENYNSEKHGLIGNTIQKIFISSDKKIWIGTGAGLDVFDKQNKTFTHIIFQQYAEKSSIQGAIQEDSKGNIWVGSWGGLHKISKNLEGNYQTKLFTNSQSDSSSLNDNRIISLFIDKNDIIWAGTFGSGLNKITQISEDKIFCEHFTEFEGLPNNVIYSIFDDTEENIWLSTNNGISKFNQYSEEFTNYDKSDGLQSNEFFWGAGYKSSEGEIFFGGISGLNAFFPQKIINNSYTPPIVITDFKMFNTSVKIGYKTALKKSITELDEITLNYDDEVISFEFSALHFSVPEKNKYAYKLEGFNKEWIYTDAENRIATYTNLDPGTYIFRVKGSNSDGIWNENGTQIKIIVKPPFWEKWWFRISGILIFAFLIYAFIKNKINQIKKQKVKLEELVKQRTQEIQLKNKELQQQKEEILTQSEKLSVVNKQLETQNQKIKTQNELITGSIRYAKTIQQSILPPQTKIDKYFDSFLIYRPKNIVSGDFYWFNKIQFNQNTEYLYFATVDCTGHGVPGAFMSLIGSRLLNEILLDKQFYQPNEILTSLDEEIKISLNQDSSNNTDGMDIILCRIEKSINEKENKYKMSFSGAKIPLIFYNSKTKKVERIQTCKRHIGGVTSKTNDSKFENHKIELNKGDALYLCSDGFVDQNDSLRKRFGSKKFIKIIEEIADKTVEIQENRIIQELLRFQKNEEQRDDITVWGIKI